MLEPSDTPILEALMRLEHEVWKFRRERFEFERNRSGSRLVTKHDLQEMEKRIMSQLSDYTDKIEAEFTAIGTGIQALLDKITQINNSPGPISPADQALLDKTLADGQALVDKVQAGPAATPPPATP